MERCKATRYKLQQTRVRSDTMARTIRTDSPSPRAPPGKTWLPLSQGLPLVGGGRVPRSRGPTIRTTQDPALNSSLPSKATQRRPLQRLMVSDKDTAVRRLAWAAGRPRRLAAGDDKGQVKVWRLTTDLVDPVRWRRRCRFQMR